jgi:hypothetical protein
MASTRPLVIPLGCDCLPRISATLFGIKKKKQDGELTYPLDFGCWPIEMVEFLLESDFDGMTEASNLLVRPAPFGFSVLCDRRFPSSSYNHEMAPATQADYVANDFRAFRERYDRRIEHFRRALELADAVLFVLSVTTLIPRGLQNNATENGLDRMLAALQARYPRCRMKMLVVVQQPFSGMRDGWRGDIFVINLPVLGPYTMCFYPYLQPMLAAHDVYGRMLRALNCSGSALSVETDFSS